MVSTKTMSTCRLSRCATESKIARGDLAQRVEQKVHHPIRRVVGEIRTHAGDQRPVRPTQPTAASLLAGSSARCATSATSTRSAASARRRRSAATRCSAAPTPSRPHNWSSSHAPPKRRESRISISPVCAAVIACCGSRKSRDRGHQPGQRVAVRDLGAAEVVDHLRRGHPGDRVAFAVRQLQIRHRRTVAVASLRLPQVHPYTTSTYLLVKSATRRNRVPTRIRVFGDSASLLPAQSLRATPKCAYELRKSGLGNRSAVAGEIVRRRAIAPKETVRRRMKP